MTVALPAVQVNVMVAFELFQPAAFGAGVTKAVIAGGAVVAVTFRFTEFEMPPWLAVIVELPLPIPVAKPVEVMVATLVLEELQVTVAVRFCVLLSE